MIGAMKPLHDEHESLLPHIEALRTAADAVGSWEVDDLRSAIADADDFLRGTLFPHAAAEEHVLYREVEHVLGTPDATRTMRRDHEEIRRLTAELESLRSALSGPPLSGEQANDLRRVLYGLFAILRLHFAKEEEEYIPLLEAHLSASGVAAMFQRMELAAREARTHPAPS
jgi:hemerythrin-like domain-containing protein